MAQHLDVEAPVDVTVARCMAAADVSADCDDDYRTLLTASILSIARTLRSMIEGETTAGATELTEVQALSKQQVQLGVPQSVMQRTYRISFCVLWEAWSSQLRQAASGFDIDRDEALLAEHLLTQIVLGYEDFVTTQAIESYARECEARSRAHLQRTVADILRDGGNAPGLDVATLHYALDNRHIAVLLPHVGEEVAAELAVEMCAATDCRFSLIYPLAGESSAVWLGRAGEWLPPALDALETTLLRAGVSAAIGSAHSGLEGFRRTLQNAVDAERIRTAWDDSDTPMVVHHKDVDLEILLLRDPQLARRFAERELGPLAQPTAKATRLRETLEASLRLGSHVAAAEYLRLHEHSVRNRLHRAERILGYSMKERRTELHVAARLMRVLSAEDRG